MSFKKKVLLLGLLFFFSFFSVSSVYAVFVRLDTPNTTVLEDSYTAAGAVDTNYGNGEALSIRGQEATGDFQRAFIKFNMSSIPSGAVIYGVNLTLFVITAENVQLKAHNVHHVYQIAVWDEHNITWANDPCGAYGAFDNGTACNLTSVDSNLTPIVVGSYFNFSIVGPFKNALAAGDSNFSVVVRMGEDTASPTSGYAVGSKDNQTVSGRPFLGVLYNQAPSAGTVSESSTAANPTNVGSSVTFSGTLSDPDAESLKLFVCDTDVNPGTSAGSCAVTEYCSDTDISGNAFSCTYAVQEADTTESWYAYLCDGFVCTGMTESDGSFVANHRPGDPSCTNQTGHDPTPDFVYTEGSDSDSDAISQVVRVGSTVYGVEVNSNTSDADSPFTTSSMSYGDVSKLYYVQMWSNDEHSFVALNPTVCSYALTNAQPTNPSTIASGKVHNITPILGFTQGSDSDTGPVDTVSHHVCVNSSSYSFKHGPSGFCDVYSNDSVVNGQLSLSSLSYCDNTCSNKTYYVSMWANDNVGTSNSNSTGYNFTLNLFNFQPINPSTIASGKVHNITPILGFTAGSDPDVAPVDTLRYHVCVNSSSYSFKHGPSGFCDVYSNDSVVNNRVSLSGLSYCDNTCANKTYYVSLWSNDDIGTNISNSTGYNFTLNLFNFQPTNPSTIASGKVHNITPILGFTAGSDPDVAPVDTLRYHVCVNSSSYSFKHGPSGFCDVYSNDSVVNNRVSLSGLSYCDNTCANKTYYVSLWSNDDIGTNISNSTGYNFTLNLFNFQPTNPSSISSLYGEPNPRLTFTPGTDPDVAPLDAVSHLVFVENGPRSWGKSNNLTYQNTSLSNNLFTVSGMSYNLSDDENEYNVTLWADDGVGTNLSNSTGYNFTYKLWYLGGIDVDIIELSSGFDVYLNITVNGSSPAFANFSGDVDSASFANHSLACTGRFCSLSFKVSSNATRIRGFVSANDTSNSYFANKSFELNVTVNNTYIQNLSYSSDENIQYFEKRYNISLVNSPVRLFYNITPLIKSGASVVHRILNGSVVNATENLTLILSGDFISRFNNTFDTYEGYFDLYANRHNASAIFPVFRNVTFKNDANDVWFTYLNVSVQSSLFPDGNYLESFSDVDGIYGLSAGQQVNHSVTFRLGNTSDDTKFLGWVSDEDSIASNVYGSLYQYNISFVVQQYYLNGSNWVYQVSRSADVLPHVDSRTAGSLVVTVDGSSITSGVDSTAVCSAPMGNCLNISIPYSIGLIGASNRTYVLTVQYNYEESEGDTGGSTSGGGGGGGIECAEGFTRVNNTCVPVFVLFVEGEFLVVPSPIRVFVVNVLAAFGKVSQAPIQFRIQSLNANVDYNLVLSAGPWISNHSDFSSREVIVKKNDFIDVVWPLFLGKDDPTLFEDEILVYSPELNESFIVPIRVSQVNLGVDAFGVKGFKSLYFIVMLLVVGGSVSAYVFIPVVRRNVIKFFKSSKVLIRRRFRKL